MTPQSIPTSARKSDLPETTPTEEQLLYAAFYDALNDKFYDALTGLPNRTGFMSRLEYAVEHAKRDAGYLFAVLFIDLDRFKIINDGLGHGIGDQLLNKLARRLEACLPPGEIVARLGGDEFTVLLNEITGAPEAVRMAQCIQNELRLPFEIGGHEVFSSASIGIALYTADYDQAEDILRNANMAMYRAKSHGGARCEVFDKGMHANAKVLLQLEIDLRRAIKRQEFCIHYQPIISIKNGRISGFEALVRWQHPQRGLILPAEFLSIAEETGLIISIDRWVLHESCHQLRQWRAQIPASTPLTLSVNLSSKQFSQPELVQEIKGILDETNIDPPSLTLELTESVIMENTDTATTSLMQLKTLGVQLATDDFGTGYSSLSYLHRFPIDTLKIDRSFISRMEEGKGHGEIVRTIIMLARKLSMEVVAEGIETESQLAQLKALQCNYGQGYFFSKPVDARAAGALVKMNFTPQMKEAHSNA